MKKTGTAQRNNGELSEREEFLAFKRAAEKWTKESTRSKETAREALALTGIYTRSGKLAKAYRSE